MFIHIHDRTISFISKTLISSSITSPTITITAASFQHRRSMTTTEPRRYEEGICTELESLDDVFRKAE